MKREIKDPHVKFNLKYKLPEDEPTLIYLFFRYNGKRLKYSTGEKVKPKYWDGQRAKYTKKHPEYVGMNSRLNNLEKNTIQIFRGSNFGEISIEDFKHELKVKTGKIEATKGVPNFLTFIYQFIEERQNSPNAKRGTWKIMLTFANHLKTYAEENGGLNYDSFDWKFKEDFENWLYRSPRNHSTNYASKGFGIIKQFLRAAERHGYHSNSIYKERGWSIPKKQVKKITLNFEELKLIAKLNLSENPRLDRVRDLFIIGAYSGLRFSDFTRIKPENIIKEDGIEMIEITTQKTGTEVVIPLLPELKRVLEKYNYTSPPKISNQKLNEYIKEVCQLAGIDENVIHQFSKSGTEKEEIVPKWKLVASHTARRSFATNFYEMGFPASELMHITGHSTEKQFMAYIHISAKRNAKNMAKRAVLMMEKRHLKVI